MRSCPFGGSFYDPFYDPSRAFECFISLGVNEKNQQDYKNDAS